MIRPISKARTLQFVHDFQIFKGASETTMQPFGQPVVAAHEAELMIRDDRKTVPPGASMIYAIHQRSENRIVKIWNVAPAEDKLPCLDLPKAA